MRLHYLHLVCLGLVAVVFAAGSVENICRPGESFSHASASAGSTFDGTTCVPFNVVFRKRSLSDQHPDFNETLVELQNPGSTFPYSFIGGSNSVIRLDDRLSPDDLPFEGQTAFAEDWPQQLNSWWKTTAMTAKDQEVTFTAEPDAGNPDTSAFKVDLDIGEDSLLKAWTGSQAVTSHARIANLPQDFSTLTIKAKGAYVFAYVNSVLVGACWDITSECEFFLNLGSEGRPRIQGSTTYFSTLTQPFLMPKTALNLDLFIARPDGTSVQPDEHLSIESTWDFGCSEECAQQGGICYNGICHCTGSSYGRHCNIEPDDMCYNIVWDIDSPYGEKRQQIAPMDVDIDYGTSATFSEIYGLEDSLSHMGYEKHRSATMILLRRGDVIALMIGLDTLNPRSEARRSLDWGFAVPDLYGILSEHGKLDLSGADWSHREDSNAMQANPAIPEEANSLWRLLTDNANPGVMDDVGDFNSAAWWSGHDGGIGQQTDGFTSNEGWVYSKGDGVCIPEIPIPKFDALTNGSYEKLKIDMFMRPANSDTEALLQQVYMVTYDPAGGYNWIKIPMKAMEKARIEVQRCCKEEVTFASFVNSVNDPGYIGQYAGNKECHNKIAPPALVEPAYLYTLYDQLGLGSGDSLNVYTTAARDTSEVCSILNPYTLETGSGQCLIDTSVEADRLNMGQKLGFAEGASEIYHSFVSDASGAGDGYMGWYAILPNLLTTTPELELPAAESCFVLDGLSSVRFKATNFDPTIEGVGCRWNRDYAMMTAATEDPEPGWFTCPLPSRDMLPGAEAYSSIALHLTSGLRGGVSPTFITVPLCSVVNFAISSLVTTSNKDRFLAGTDPVQIVGRLRSAGGFLLSGDIEDVTSALSGVMISGNLRTRLCCGPTAGDRDCRDAEAVDLVLPSQEVMGSAFDDTEGGFLWPAFDTSMITESTLCTVYAAHKNPDTYGGWSGGLDLMFVGDLADTLPTSIVMDWNFTEAATAAGSTPAGICTEYSLSPAGGVCWPDLPAEYDAAVDVSVQYSDGSEATAVLVDLTWDCKLMDGSAVPGTFTLPAIASVPSGLRQPVPRPTILDDVLCKLQGTSNIDGNVINGVTSEGALVHVQSHVAAAELLFVTISWQNGAWDVDLGGLALYNAPAVLRFDAVFGNGSYADQSFTELDVTFTCDNGVTIDPLVGSAPSDADAGLFTIVAFPTGAPTTCTAKIEHLGSGLTATTSDSMTFIPTIATLTAEFDADDLTTFDGTTFHTNGSQVDVTVAGTLSTGSPLTTQLEDVNLFWRCKDAGNAALTVLSGSVQVPLSGLVILPVPVISGVTDFIRNPVYCAATARTTRVDGSDLTIESEYVRIAPRSYAFGEAVVDPAKLEDISGEIFLRSGAETTFTGRTLWNESISTNLDSLLGAWHCHNSTYNFTVGNPDTAFDVNGIAVLPDPEITDNTQGPIANPQICSIIVKVPVPGGTPLTFQTEEGRVAPESLSSLSATFVNTVDFDGDTFLLNGIVGELLVDGSSFFSNPVFSSVTALWNCEAKNGTAFLITGAVAARAMANGTLYMPFPTIYDNPAGAIVEPVMCTATLRTPVPNSPDLTFTTSQIRLAPPVVINGVVSVETTDVSGTIWHLDGSSADVGVTGVLPWGASAAEFSALTAEWQCADVNGTQFTVSAPAPAIFESDGSVSLAYPTITDNPVGPIDNAVMCKVVVKSPVPGADDLVYESSEFRVAPGVLASGTAAFPADDLIDFMAETYHRNGSHAVVNVDGTLAWGSAVTDFSMLSAAWHCADKNGTAFTVTSPAPANVETGGSVTLVYPTITGNPTGPIDNAVMCKVVVTSPVSGGPDVTIETDEVRIVPSVITLGTASFNADDITNFGAVDFHTDGSKATVVVEGTNMFGEVVANGYGLMTAEWECKAADDTLFTVDSPTSVAVPMNGELIIDYPVISDNIPGPVVSAVLCKVIVSSPVPEADPVLFNTSVARIAPRVATSGIASFDSSLITTYESTDYLTSDAVVDFTGTFPWGRPADESGLTVHWECENTLGNPFNVVEGPIAADASGATALESPTISDNARGPIETPVFCKAVVTAGIPGGDDIEFATNLVRVAPRTLVEFDIDVEGTLYALEELTWSAINGALLWGETFDMSGASVTGSFDCLGTVSDVTGQTLTFPDVNADVAQDCTLTVTATHNGYVTTASATVSAVPLAEVQAAVADGKLKSRPSADPLHTDGFSLDVGATLRYSDDTDAVVSSGATVTLQCRADELAAYEDVSSLDLGTVATGSFDYPSMVDSRQCRLRASSTRLDAVYTSASFELAPAAIAEASVAITPLVDENGDGIPDEEVSNVTYAVTASLQNGTAATDADVSGTYTWSCCVLNATSGACFDGDSLVELESKPLTSLAGTANIPEIKSTSLCELSVELYHAVNTISPSVSGADRSVLLHIVGGTSSSGMGTGSKVLLIILLIIAATLGAWYGINKYFNNRKAEGIAPPAWFTAAQGAVMTAGAYTMGAMSNMGNSVRSKFGSHAVSNVELPEAVDGGIDDFYMEEMDF